MAKIFGQLEKAQAENTTSDTGSLAKGTMTYRTDLNQMKVSDGTNMQTLMDLTTAQTATNKTLTSPTLTTPTVDVPLFDGQGSAPSSPSSGYYKMYFKDADGKPYYKNSAGVETAFGSGSGGSGINYIANPDSNTDTTGWTTYDDSAATPVDLTGGSFGGTFARTTTTPLRGDGSFLYTLGTAGEGVAYTITPDLADCGNVLEFGFDYDFVSATGATGDYTVWVYDVANSVLIQPAGYQVPGATTGIYGKFKCTFQVPINATTLRIGIHQAASTSAALEFDNVYCGPQTKSYGAFISDWQSWTPTGTWTSNVTYSGFWRRVGSDAEFDVAIACSGAQTSSYLGINLPSGFTIDTAKMTTVNSNGQYIVGRGTALDDAVANYDLVVKYSTTTQVVVRALNSSSTYTTDSTVTQALPITFGSGDRVHVQFKVPIVGWSSGQLLSSDADTRVVAARATGGTTTVNNTSPILVHGTSTFDTHGAYSTSTGRYTVPVPGIYRVSAYVKLGSVAWSAGNGIEPTVFKNGSSYTRLQTNVIAAGITVGGMSANGSALVSCVAGDILDVRVYSDQSVAADSASWVQFERISGPSQIAASELIACRYTSAAGQSISHNTTTIIDFGTKDFDSHNAVTTGASWKFTAPVSGTYSVCSLIIYASGGGWAAGENAQLLLYKNNSSYAFLDSYNAQATHSTFVQVRGQTSIKLLAGDYIDIRTYQDSGGSIALNASAATTHVSITRTGNY